MPLALCLGVDDLWYDLYFKCCQASQVKIPMMPAVITADAIPNTRTNGAILVTLRTISL